LAPLLDNDHRKIELAFSLLFTLPGSPVIYYGDEIGMGDNIWLPDRNGVRTPMQWTKGHNGGFSLAEPERLYTPPIENVEFGIASVNVVDQENDPASLLNSVRRMIQIRKAHPAFGWGDFAWAMQSSQAEDKVATYWRTHNTELLLVIQNLTDQDQAVHLESTHPCQAFQDLLTGARIPLPDSHRLELSVGPYQYRWLICLNE